MNVVLAWAIRLLELLFVIGCFGSLVVILLSGVEDVETVFKRTEETESQPVHRDGL